MQELRGAHRAAHGRAQEAAATKPSSTCAPSSRCRASSSSRSTPTTRARGAERRWSRTSRPRSSRINALYDAELARLRKLWAGARRPLGRRSGRCRRARRRRHRRTPRRPSARRPAVAPPGALSRASAQQRARPRAGSALPRLAFIAWPTSALNAFSLPARNSSTDFGLAAITVVDDALELARVAHLAQAAGLDRARRRRSPLALPQRVEHLARGRCSRWCRRRCARSAPRACAAGTRDRRRAPAGVQAPRDLAHHPVGDQLAARRLARGGRVSK